MRGPNLQLSKLRMGKGLRLAHLAGELAQAPPLP